MDRVQDITLNDISLKSLYITNFLNGNYSDAFNLLNNNPQLATKTFVAEIMNEISSMLFGLENNFYDGIITYLQNTLDGFQNIIDNYKNMGNYSSQTEYQIYNFVYYNEKVFMFINSSSAMNILPTNSEYWLEIGLKGEIGAYGIGGNLQYIWDANTPYSQLDVVYYDNSLWIAKQNNNGQIPSTGDYWEELIKFNLIQIYSSTTQPENLFNGMIWMELESI